MHDPTAVWSVPKRLGFLVMAIFLFLSAAPLVVQVVPGLGDAAQAGYQALWNVVVVWTGEHVLGLAEPITVLPNGSGDTTWNYVQLFDTVMLALIVGGAWALADRKRPNYAALHEGLMVVVRYGLGATMVIYGLMKVFKGQFPFPSLTTLTQTYGESSPMGLAWSFMGYSTAYNLFTGGAEVLAGALLLWRRTATLGALVALGVTAHIVALNFSYDIPVKLFSATLLLMSVYVLADDLRRVVDVLVFGRASAAVSLPRHFAGKRAREARVALKSIFVGLLGVMALMLWNMSSEEGPRPPLYGLYEVESFTLDGVVRPPLTTDGQRWRQLIVEAYGFAVVRTMDSKRDFFAVKTDTEARTIVLSNSHEGVATEHRFTYEQPSPEALVLHGTLATGAAQMTLRKVDPDSFLLVNRGFHWVNEQPFNR